MSKLTHKQKLKKARKMMTHEEVRKQRPPFMSEQWWQRKLAIHKKSVTSYINKQ